MHSSNYIIPIVNSSLLPTSNFDVHLSFSNPQPFHIHSHTHLHIHSLYLLYSHHIIIPLPKKLPCHPFLSHEF